MDAETMTALFSNEPREQVVRDIVQRSRLRLEPMTDDALAHLLEDALYQERKRLERATPHEGEKERLDRLARALTRGDRNSQIEAGMSLVSAWADEIHGRFDTRIYRFATRILPGALTGLLSKRKRPSVRKLLAGQRPDIDITSRVIVRGDVQLIQDLTREATLVLCPTHVSNLDSPLIGLALHLAGLPPFTYGAGLNLFSNPAMGFFLRRLGAYTVDRTKRAELYKHVLKDYSTRCIATHRHSLFFPGGTRARDGRIERHLKKGLLGTAVTAWQQRLEAGEQHPDVYIIPMTLSFQLVLEANTLINDHLEIEGQHQYIITDDEFAEPRTVAGFARRVLDLDDSVTVHFGAPIDCLGNPVAADPEERREQSLRRRRYVCGGDGRVEWDEQRDHQYTLRLGEALVAAYPKGAAVMASHAVAFTAWNLLEERIRSTDAFRLVRVPVQSRQFTRRAVVERLAKVLDALRRGDAEGRWEDATQGTAEQVLDAGLQRFTLYHRTRAVSEAGDQIVIEDAKLCLYYRNRLDHPALLGAFTATEVA